MSPPNTRLTVDTQTWFAQDGYVYQDALDGPTICEIEEATPDQVRAIAATPDLVRAGRAILGDPACAAFVQTVPFQALTAAIGKVDGLAVITPEDGLSVTTREG
ncbi:hypothetical protein BBAL3_2116 [Brevundimonas sp. BAL3]|uniref:hypothetical protein n=1 Tax=Brevundimonas sp. BAL3 TaxID=391600 RepID=UPI00017EBEAE|nr:hypothetical protein [Brevundimonas sp. BAL3]EDX80959.1 hypothetical protein BBAL3_2116 [Brevundimonas sp. BAL3]